MKKYNSLAEDIAKKISDMIFKDGTFPAGSRLPNEATLSELLGVSRTSIREAVKILVANNILTINRGVGTFVVDEPTEEYDPFSIFSSSGKVQNILDAFEIRLYIEPGMITDIFSKATPEDIKLILTLEENCRNKIHSGDSYETEDLQFHQALCKASHNTIYERLMESLQSTIVVMQHSAKHADVKKALEENALVWHKKITDCIKANDPTGTKIACENHVYTALHVISELAKYRDLDNKSNGHYSLAQETADKLTKIIIDDTVFLPGARIPNEDKLSEMLSVSRTSIREAVKILIANDILEIRRGVGTFVKDISNSAHISFNSLYGNSIIQQAKDALRLRLLLEPQMAALAALRASEEDLEMISSYAQRCRQLIIDSKDYSFADAAFHKAIAKATHNSYYEKLLPMIHYSIANLLHSIEYTDIDDLNRENALRYHSFITECLQNRDTSGISIAVKTHIYDMIQYLKISESIP